MNRRNLARSKLAIIMASFFLPLLIAWIFFAHPDLMHNQSKNHGKLLQPIKTIDDFSAVNISSGNNLGLEEITKKWTLLLISDGSCSLDCEANIFKMRQIRASLGKEIPRVRSMLVLLPAAEISENTRQIIGRGNPPVLAARFDHSFYGTDRLFASLQQEHIYIIDPNGNIIIEYADGTASSDIKKDIKNLLKSSRIG